MGSFSALAALDRRHIVISWELEDGPGTEWKVSRRESEDALYILLVSGLVADDLGRVTYRDGAVEQGRVYQYKIELLGEGSFLYETQEVYVPIAGAKLDQNVPNPFNPSTTIEFAIPDGGSGAGAVARLTVYDVRGSLVRVLVDEFMTPGIKKVVWNGRDKEGRAVASGVYFYLLRSGTYVKTTGMVLFE